MGSLMAPSHPPTSGLNSAQLRGSSKISGAARGLGSTRVDGLIWGGGLFLGPALGGGPYCCLHSASLTDELMLSQKPAASRKAAFHWPLRSFTVADAGSSGVLAGFGISGELRPRGGDQAVVGQLLHPEVPGGAAVYPVVPRRNALVVVVLPGAVCGEDERL